MLMNCSMIASCGFTFIQLSDFSYSYKTFSTSPASRWSYLRKFQRLNSRLWKIVWDCPIVGPYICAARFWHFLYHIFFVDFKFHASPPVRLLNSTLIETVDSEAVNCWMYTLLQSFDFFCQETAGNCNDDSVAKYIDRNRYIQVTHTHTTHWWPLHPINAVLQNCAFNPWELLRPCCWRSVSLPVLSRHRVGYKSLASQLHSLQGEIPAPPISHLRNHS